MIPITIPTVKLFPGTIIFSKLCTPFKPSMAEATEIGGVMMPSANNVAAPSIAGKYNQCRYRHTNAYREKIPPSPLLSACNVRIIYLKVVCKVSVQKTQEIPPYTSCSVICLSPMIDLKTYKGEVPMSPKMIPNVTNTPAAEMCFK